MRALAQAAGTPVEASAIICPLPHAVKPAATLMYHLSAMQLRLFPLQTVLFPGMRMPLHIFEERYRTMIRECIEEDAPFGVLLIREGAEVGGGAVPHNTGTTARITQVEYLEDGRMNIFTIGAQRFRVSQISTEREYLTGDVEIIEQAPPTGAAQALMPRARDLFNDYLRTYLAMSDQWTRGVALPDDPAEAADYIAARTDTLAEIKQKWLEELAPETRLAHELEVIEEALPEMRARLAARLHQKTAGFAVLN
jgi:Lon protease-like protein